MLSIICRLYEFYQTWVLLSVIQLLTILTVYQRTISSLRLLMASYLLTILIYHNNHISKQCMLETRVYVVLDFLNRDPDIKYFYSRDQSTTSVFRMVAMGALTSKCTFDVFP